MKSKRARWIAWRRPHPFLVVALAVSIALAGGGCFSGEEGEPFYGRVVVPRAQEFRWSDGGLPQTFDPALAAAPPDTDVIRALFEGLTDYDPRSLAPVSAVALRWESSRDGREWTFHLRRDARWSNGDAVTAQDFVRSWQRILRLGERAPHAKLLANIEGAQPVAVTNAPEEGSPTAPDSTRAGASLKTREQPVAPAAAPAFGVEAVGDYVLNVRLRRPDKNFPALVAHPVFRPVHELTIRNDSARDAEQAESESAPPEVVSNGAFRLSERQPGSVVLEREKSYWDAPTVALERVRFVATRDAEEALAAYRAGDVDAVTNAAFEPLALKLLAPYKDFRRATYGALTYYSINMERPPFDDRRVREALAIALDRERLSADAMGGATEPAARFLPIEPQGEKNPAARKAKGNGEGERPIPLAHDAERARRLLAEAGFPGGAGFPRVRLLVNRNDQQRAMAQAVAEMWRSVLGVETEIDVRVWDDYEAALRAGDYDVARRSMVMQTTDEETNMLAMFDGDAQIGAAPPESDEIQKAEPASTAAGPGEQAKQGELPSDLRPQREPILTEARALEELPAIPVYFASSYALVKPYVTGFDANLLDAPSLKRVRINESWKPPKQNDMVRIARGE